MSGNILNIFKKIEIIKKLTPRNILKNFFMPDKKFIINFLHCIYYFKNINFKKFKQDKTILIYDLRCNPITFDFINYIFYVFCSLKARKKSINFDLILYLPKNYKIIPFEDENYSKFISSEDIFSRIYNLILPLAKSFSFIKKIDLIYEKNLLLKRIREYNIIYPRNYNPTYFIIRPFDSLKCTKYFYANNLSPKQYLIVNEKVDKKNKKLLQTLNGSKFITLTLRDYGFLPQRNIKQIDIDKISLVAKKLGAKLILVPDDIKKISSYKISKEVVLCELARKDINTRITIYAKSILNIFPPCGPALVSFFSKNPKTIILNFCSGGGYDNENYFKKYCNFKLGDQPYRRLGGFLMWQKIYPNYTSEDIIEIYKSLCIQKE